MTSAHAVDCNRDALEREAVRLCRRYLEEVILPFDLCPWAAPALRQQRVEITPVLQQVTNLHELRDAAGRGAEMLAAAAAETELVLVLFPLFRLGRYDFDALLRALRNRPEAAGFVMAAFHPAAALDSTDPERLIPFLRRSPDPMVQAVRSEVLERINPGRGTGTAFVTLDRLLAGDLDRPAEPSPRERVARANWDTIQRSGAESLTEALTSIHDDRRRTYERLGFLEKTIP